MTYIFIHTLICDTIIIINIKVEYMNKLVFISIDALGETEWDKIKELKNFKEFIDNGVFCKNLTSIFPTLTYPVHTTIVTGMYPNKHGVIHNNPFQPFVNKRDMEWYWYDSNIKSPKIYDIVKEKGGRVASLLWPVSGKTSIKYNMPEIIAIDKENQVLKVLKNGSTCFIVEMELRFARQRISMKQPHLDDYVTDCAVHTIKHKKPDLMMVHLVNLDVAKHEHRNESLEVDEAIIRMHDNISRILKVVDDDTTVIMMGDHGQISIDYNVSINNLLLESGLIYDNNGKFEYNAYMQCSCGSAYLHARDVESEKKAFEVLEKAMNSGFYGIEKIYSNADMISMRVSDDIKGGVEAFPGYNFSDEITKETIMDLKAEGITRANHGYNPDKKDYKCIFMAMGKQIKQKGELPSMNMVDVAPTIAEIMDIGTLKCDGVSIFGKN